VTADPPGAAGRNPSHDQMKVARVKPIYDAPVGFVEDDGLASHGAVTIQRRSGSIPCLGACRVGRLNLDGDGQGDLAGHGASSVPRRRTLPPVRKGDHHAPRAGGALDLLLPGLPALTAGFLMNLAGMAREPVVVSHDDVFAPGDPFRSFSSTGFCAMYFPDERRVAQGTFDAQEPHAGRAAGLACGAREAMRLSADPFLPQGSGATGTAEEA